MWRRHSIAARKAAGDQAKGKTYSMMSKIIQLAAKKWADAKMNPSLELALQKARYCGVPRDIVDRAILKWSGQLEGENLEEVFYEGYGPAGSAFLIKTLTPNTNRTASNIKAILSRHWGALGLQNSVARQFQEKGIFVIDGTTETINDKGKTVEKITPLNQGFENAVIEMPILDFEMESNTAVIYTDKNNFISVQRELEEKKYHIVEADLQYEAENMISLSEENKQQFLTLIQALENDEDVDKVRHNVENA